MRGLEGRVAIVTGAGSGIGAAIARRLAEEGVQVALADIDLDATRRVADDIARAKPGSTLAVYADIANSASVDTMVARVFEALGAPTILINNAGVNVFGEPLSITDADWRRCMAVDLEGAWNCSRAVLPSMIGGRRGAIVNIASNHSFQVIKGYLPLSRRQTRPRRNDSRPCA